jgi:hypothetical protein
MSIELRSISATALARTNDTDVCGGTSVASGSGETALRNGCAKTGTTPASTCAPRRMSTVATALANAGGSRRAAGSDTSSAYPSMRTSADPGSSPSTSSAP